MALMLLILVFGVASVAASEDTGDSVKATDESTTIEVSDSGNVTLTQSDSGDDGNPNNNLGTEQNEVYSSSDEDVLTAADGTFTDLYNKVKNGGTVTLDRNYVYTASKDSAYVNGITLDKAITINGNGFTINGNKAARIFQVTGDNVILDNLNLINGYTYDSNAAAIYWTGSYGTLSNTILRDNAGHNNGKTSYGGGAIYVGGNHITITDCQFIKNNGTGGTGDPQGGSAIYWGGQYGILTKTNFTDNYQKNYDGTVQWRGYHGIISYCNFKGNKNDGKSPQGAAISIYSANNVSTIGCNFEDSYCSSWGVLIVWLSPNSQVINCTFKNNDALYGTLVSNCNNVNISGCEFTGNTARTGNGAGIYLSGTNNEITDCTFTNNNALVGSGGAIYSTQSTTIRECTFTSNSAATNGNEVATNNGINLILDSNDFNGKSLPSSSEGYFGTDTHIDYSPLYVSLNGNGDGLTRNTPTNWVNAYSKIPEHGTIILLSGTYTNIVNQVIDKPVTIKGLENVVIDARKTGRIFNITADDVHIDGINFINGYVTNSHGGAIHWTGNNGVLSNSIFKDNSAITNNKVNLGGGAVYIGGNYTLVTDCEFIGNNITGNSDPQGGSAVYWGGHNGTLTKSIFKKNHSFGFDGTVQWRGYDGVLSYSNFTENSVSGYSPEGSAICAYLANNFTLMGCNFDKNYGSSWGVVIIWRTPNSKVIDCNFTNNNATYGTLTTCSPNTLIDGCEFINNTARSGDGSAIYVRADYDSGVNTTVSNSKFINNTARNGGAISWAANNGTLTNSEFINNTATNNGGAVYNVGSNLVISDSTFEGNSAPNGDSIQSTQEITITHCEIENQLSISVTGNNAGSTATLTGTFANGAPAKVDVYVDGTKKGTANVNDKTFTYQITGLGVGEHTITLTDSNGNTYEFGESGIFIETASTIYVATTEASGATGLTESSPVLWSKAIKYINPNGKIIFKAGSYSDVIIRVHLE